MGFLMQSVKSTKPIKTNNFSFRLSELRIKHDVSSRTMSLALGQNISYVNNIECQKTFPSLATFFSICDYFHIPPADFFDFDNHDPELIHSITEYLKKIKKEQLDYMETLIRDLAK